ncbi:hypothetical protein BDZ91DRAFT_725353 [Kalaharituber pfeilii]|nr:hypothetical protein BDZ91DRAFT_725353 [Kalaharituber pfeilii]
MTPELRTHLRKKENHQRSRVSVLIHLSDLHDYLCLTLYKLFSALERPDAHNPTFLFQYFC